MGLGVRPKPPPIRVQLVGQHRSGVRRVRVAQRLLYAGWVSSCREPEHADRLHLLPLRQPSVGQREEGTRETIAVSLARQPACKEALREESTTATQVLFKD